MTIIVKNASAKDVNWIVELLIEGARDGHFQKGIALNPKEMVQSILNNGGINILKLREKIQAPVYVAAKITIAEIDGDPASFLITFIEGDEVELHLAATKKQYRGNGGFKELVNHEISMYKSSNKLYARCYKKSSWAINCFKRANFKITKKGDPFELTFCG